MRAERGLSGGRSAARWGAEALVAIVFLLLAAETLAHRDFSPDPRYRSGVVLFALATATVGTMPLLFHLSPRLLKLSAALLAAVLVGFGVLALTHRFA